MSSVSGTVRVDTFSVIYNPVYGGGSYSGTVRADVSSPVVVTLLYGGNFASNVYRPPGDLIRAINRCWDSVEGKLHIWLSPGPDPKGTYYDGPSFSSSTYAYLGTTQ